MITNYSRKKVRSVCNHPFISSCIKGDLEEVKNLFHKVENIDLVAGRNPLIEACEAEHLDIVKFLLQNGADVNYQKEYNISPLMSACMIANVEIVEELLKYGANITFKKRPYSYSVLSKMISVGKTEIIEKLIEKITPEEVDFTEFSSKHTHLGYACKRGDFQVVKKLLEKGASVNLPEFENYSAFDVVVETRNLDMIKLLIEKVKNQKDCFIPVSSLYLACRNNYSSIAKELILSEIEFDFRKNYAQEPLVTLYEMKNFEVYSLLLNCKKYGKKRVIEYCFGIENYRHGIRNKQDYPVILKDILDVKQENFEEGLLEVLLCSFLEIKSIETCLTITFNHENFDREKMFSLVCNGKGNIYNRTIILDFLLKSMKDLNFRDKDGNTPLIFLCKNEDNEKFIKEILEKGGCVSDYNHKEKSALMYACKYGYESYVEELLNYNDGVMTDLQDKRGLTAIDYCLMNCIVYYRDAEYPYDEDEDYFDYDADYDYFENKMNIVKKFVEYGIYIDVEIVKKYTEEVDHESKTKLLKYMKKRFSTSVKPCKK